jgi:hypothetical protein
MTEALSSPAPLPCPFGCDSTPRIHAEQGETFLAGHACVWHANVECDDCDAGQHAEAPDKDAAIALAIEAWNRRLSGGERAAEVHRIDQRFFSAVQRAYNGRNGLGEAELALNNIREALEDRREAMGKLPPLDEAKLIQSGGGERERTGATDASRSIRKYAEDHRKGYGMESTLAAAYLDLLDVFQSSPDSVSAVPTVDLTQIGYELVQIAHAAKLSDFIRQRIHTFGEKLWHPCNCGLGVQDGAATPLTPTPLPPISDEQVDRAMRMFGLDVSDNHPDREAMRNVLRQFRADAAQLTEASSLSLKRDA